MQLFQAHNSRNRSNIIRTRIKWDVTVLRRDSTWRLFWRRSTWPLCQYLVHVSSNAKSFHQCLRLTGYFGHLRFTGRVHSLGRGLYFNGNFWLCTRPVSRICHEEAVANVDINNIVLWVVTRFAGKLGSVHFADPQSMDYPIWTTKWTT